MAKVRSNKPLHFPVTNKQLGELFTLDFTAAEWRLYLYLVTLDPFGDSGAKYNAEEAMLFCKIKRSTYFVAKAKFVELGLFEFIDGVTKVRNLKGIRVQSEVLDSYTEIQDTDSLFKSEVSQSETSDRQSEVLDRQSEVLDLQSEVSDWEPLKVLPAFDFESLHTLSDLNQTLSEAEIEKIAREEIEYFYSKTQKDSDLISRTQDLDRDRELKIDGGQKFEQRDLNLISQDRDSDLKTDRLDRDLNRQNSEHENQGTKITVQNQPKTTTNSLTPIQTQEDPIQVPQPAAPPEISFLDWVKQNKAQHARNPAIYAQTCINRDKDGSLRAEYEQWLAMRKDPIYCHYKPETITLPPPEERLSIVARAREMLRSRGIKV
jgi:hypothetical protein